jgi:hypothetical protein
MLNSMFPLAWEIGAYVLHNTNKLTFTVCACCKCMLKICVENFFNCEESMKYAFSIVMYVLQE